MAEEAKDNDAGPGKDGGIDLPAWSSALALDDGARAESGSGADAAHGGDAAPLARTPSGKALLGSARRSLGPARRVKTPVRRVEFAHGGGGEGGGGGAVPAIPPGLREKQRTDFDAFVKMMAGVLIKCFEEEAGAPGPNAESSPEPAAEPARQPPPLPPKTPQSVTKRPGALGTPLRVKSAAKPRRLAIDDDAATDGAGSVVGLAVVRSKDELEGAVGSSVAVTPVRRSARTQHEGAVLRDANALLERAGFAYTPNKMFGAAMDAAADDGGVAEGGEDAPAPAEPQQRAAPSPAANPPPRRSARLKK